MKKVIGICCLALAMCLFAGCMSTPNVSPEDLAEYQYASEKMTPENSVVFAAFLTNLDPGSYLYQIDPKYPEDVQEQKYWSVICSKPVKPGSTYVIKNLSWSQSDAMGNRYIGSIDETSRFKIKVPNKPGIYFVCLTSIHDIYAYEANPDFEYRDRLADKDKAVNYISGFAQQILPFYVGTSWEPLIQQYIEHPETYEFE